MTTLLVTFQLGLMLHATADPGSPTPASLVLGAVLVSVHLSFIVWFVAQFCPQAVSFLKLRVEAARARFSVGDRLLGAGPAASGPPPDPLRELARRERERHASPMAGLFRGLLSFRRMRRMQRVTLRNDESDTPMVDLTGVPTATRDMPDVVPEVLREAHF